MRYKELYAEQYNEIKKYILSKADIPALSLAGTDSIALEVYSLCISIHGIKHSEDRGSAEYTDYKAEALKAFKTLQDELSSLQEHHSKDTTLEAIIPLLTGIRDRISEITNFTDMIQNSAQSNLFNLDVTNIAFGILNEIIDTEIYESKEPMYDILGSTE